MLVFDIETAPLPDEDYILSLADPFAPKPHPGEFDPAKVKYGRTKDEAKRAAILAENQEKHAALVENYAAEVEADRAAWRTEALDKAALNAATGQLVVIGVGDALNGKFGSTEQLIDKGGTEADQLAWFWQKYEACRRMTPKPRPMIGHNIKQFDLPFLVLRSRILSVDVPREVFDPKWRKWDELFVDTADYWLLGRQWNGCKFSLEHIGQALGLGGKQVGPDGKPINGGDFYKLWREDRELARKYLHRDLELTARIAVRLGVG